MEGGMATEENGSQPPRRSEINHMVKIMKIMGGIIKVYDTIGR
jgi:hypothetical protein